MDNKEVPKPRRPLPTPGASPAQRPNTPVLGISAPVPAASFYSAHRAPPLPTRPLNVGSSHTAYVAPQEPPPNYSSGINPPGFREPELVNEDMVVEPTDPSSTLVPQNNVRGWTDRMGQIPYESGWQETNTWDQYTTTTSDWAGGSMGFDPMDYMSTNTKKTHWWDASERERAQRPGPGMLPPVLADELHNPDHSLFSDATPPPQPSATSSSNMPSSAPAPIFVPPTEEDVRTAVPHPNAYYCPKENGWIILSWKSSSVAPPLANSFQKSPHPPLPDQNRRKLTSSCIGDGEQPFGQNNKTHHFHKYPKAVDSHKLTPPFYRDDWEINPNVKQKRRAGTIILGEADLRKMKSDNDDMEKECDLGDEGRSLDLYICCQCSFYCVASGVIPGVITRKFFDEFVKDKRGSPPPGKTGEQAVVLALETFLLILENRLWKGEGRMLKITRTGGFQNKIGWNPNVKRIFEILGFIEEVGGKDLVLLPPPTEPINPTGKQNRRKLLRAWVEISAWLVDFRRVHAAQLKDQRAHKLSVTIDSAREMYQLAIGAHPDQVPRGELSSTLMIALGQYQKEWQSFGLTPTSYSPDLLGFGYLAQCRCDPAGTLSYFTNLSNFVKIMEELASCPPQLQELLVAEKSRDRFTTDDIVSAATVLGFGLNGPLRVEFDLDIPDEFIENAWKDCVKRSWKDPLSSDLHRDANAALKIIAEARGSHGLRKIWEAGKDRLMTPDRAYDTLEIPKDVDDNMVITVYTMRLEEQPLQMDKMREALTVIAEVRDSERLRQFLSSGQDPGDIVTPIRPDLPRGLNQLGNTCYLNSLLQYFYTIKDLREAVTPMAKLDLKSLDDDKLSEDDIKRHRVGGRLVTRREIIRSKKCGQLAELFFHMEYCETGAVTPTVELAKLALVTSRDEEEDEVGEGGTDSSNDTDATLVEDGPSRSHVTDTSPGPSQSSVLGKRPRDVGRRQSEMDVDSPGSESPKDKDGFVMVHGPQSSRLSEETATPSSSKLPEASTSTLVPDNSMDVDLRTTSEPPKAPALPPRRPAPVSDSVMMFGKQHDVAECMDNCMFQIETALLKFDGMSDSPNENAEKTSVVKRLFYGTIRQRLTGDLFSHLPVNVINDGVDIYDGLSGYFDDVVDFEGKKARMEVSLVDLPPILQIQLQRVQFNRDTLQPYKSQAYVKFGETIYMDRFMDHADPQKKAQSKAIQSELNLCRERVRTLVESKDGPLLTSLEHTSKFLSKLEGPALPEVDEELILHLTSEQAVVKDEIDQLRTRISQLKYDLEAVWKDNTEVAYELTSVFIHRGSSPSWGHYFFYSRHLPESPDSWFKYNDSDVSVISKDEVLADTTGSTANPYLVRFCS
ncbi:hypothetical protein BD779DRAFT_1607774 [Infundibulicybe gibba]|nr:hypothetical protein BD779DRAFT_1607774 [Infundibulicybe gibba]